MTQWGLGGAGSGLGRRSLFYVFASSSPLPEIQTLLPWISTSEDVSGSLPWLSQGCSTGTKPQHVSAGSSGSCACGVTATGPRTWGRRGNTPVGMAAREGNLSACLYAEKPCPNAATRTQDRTSVRFSAEPAAGLVTGLRTALG